MTALGCGLCFVASIATSIASGDVRPLPASPYVSHTAQPQQHYQDPQLQQVALVGGGCESGSCRIEICCGHTQLGPLLLLPPHRPELSGYSGANHRERDDLTKQSQHWRDRGNGCVHCCVTCSLTFCCRHSSPSRNGCGPVQRHQQWQLRQSQALPGFSSPEKRRSENDDYDDGGDVRADPGLCPATQCVVCWSDGGSCYDAVE